MISHKHNFIFLHIPKCAGTSVEDLFGAWENKKYFYVGNGRQHFFMDKILKKNTKCSNYFKFSFVRNPWDRFVSLYKYTSSRPKNIKLKLSFYDFCINLDKIFDMKQRPRIGHMFHSETLCRYLLNEKGEEIVDFIGRFENLQQDFNIVCDKIGIPHQKLPHNNTTKHKHYTEYYDNETREIVEERYAKDIEYFGYKFGE